MVSDGTETERDKFQVAFVFTKTGATDLKAGVWTGPVARRIIKAELGLDPSTDIRYNTDDPRIFADLMVIAYLHSDGGWFCVNPMPKETTVYHYRREFGSGDKND